MEIRNKKMNNQGFTVVELVVSFGLTMLIAVFLFQLLVQMKQLYISDGLKTELLTRQSLITKTISEDFNRKKIKYATNCGQYCLNFTFDDHTTKQFKVDRIRGTIRYGTYATKLVEHSKIGSMKVSTETPTMTTSGGLLNYNSFIQIHIPITHPLFQEDYGIHLIYQYNNHETALNNIVFDGTGQTEYLYLKGLEEMVISQTSSYVEPGYFVITSDGRQVDQDPRVSVSCNVKNVIGSYTCTYSFYDQGKLINTRTRKIVVMPEQNNYEYTGNVDTFIAPVTGTYQISLWGAQGGSASGGKGAYTTGTISLTKGEKLYIHVGEHKEHRDVGAAYNGGGHAALETSSEGNPDRYNSGGGATDIRLLAGKWDDFNGLKSRIMVAAGGGGASYYMQDGRTYGGGHGGALIGGAGLKIDPSDTNITPPTGATQTSGGKGGIGLHTSGTDGSFGKGADALKFLNAGGGGYYGGGSSGVSVSSATSGSGGSSFISGYTGCDAISNSSTVSHIIHTGNPNHYSGKLFVNGQMIAGNQSMPTHVGTGTMTGNSGHGYAKIQLMSIISSN